MKKLEKAKSGLFCLLLMLVALAVLTACGSKAATAVDKIELGQKYLTELNYTEAVASFTEAIKLDPDNIQAYMGRAEAYMALGEYDKALADYRFVSGKTEDMPYTRALSYIGQAEVHEKMEQPARAISDYGLAKALLKASDAGKAENVSEKDVSAKLVQVLYVHAALCETLTNYNAALEDYNDLLELGENTAAKRDEVLSQLGETAEDENGLTDAEEPATESTAEEPAEEPTEESAPGQEAASESESQSAKEETKQEEPASSSEQAAELAQADGAKVYDKIKETLSTDDAKAAMQNLLARGYRLRYYDANGKMLAVYANETAWADVNMEENGTITAEALTAADPSAEDIGAVSLSKLYVYYGGCEGRSREGAGLWFILNPGKKDLTAESYTWKNDKAEGDFKQKEESKSVAAMESGTSAAQGKTHNWKTVFDAGTYSVSCQEGGTTVAYAIKFSDAYKAQFAEAPNASALIALYA